MKAAAASGAAVRYSRLAVAVMIATMFAGSTIVTPLYTLYANAFGFGPVVLTLVYSAYVIGNLGALLMFGQLSDQIGRKRTVLPALAVAGLSAAAFLAARGTPLLFVGRALSGLAIGVATGAGTAWLVELEGKATKGSAAFVSTTANLIGLTGGVLVAGALVDHAPWPLRLIYVVYIVWVAAVVAAIAFAVEPIVKRSGAISIIPEIAVPRAIRAAFAAPAITAFCTFAFVGFYAALVPSLVAERLHVTAHFAGAGIVALLFVIAAIVTVPTRRVGSVTAMRVGLAVQLPALALLFLADRLASLPLILAASGVGGIALALTYRGSLAVVNEIAPPDRKAAMVSAYLICCFSGNALPVIGVALVSQALGDPIAGVAIFAALLGILAVGALILSRKGDGRHARA